MKRLKALWKSTHQTWKNCTKCIAPCSSVYSEQHQCLTLHLPAHHASTLFTRVQFFHINRNLIRNTCQAVLMSSNVAELHDNMRTVHLLKYNLSIMMKLAYPVWVIMHSGVVFSLSKHGKRFVACEYLDVHFHSFRIVTLAQIFI